MWVLLLLWLVFSGCSQAPPSGLGASAGPVDGAAGDGEFGQDTAKADGTAVDAPDPADAADPGAETEGADAPNPDASLPDSADAAPADAPAADGAAIADATDAASSACAGQKCSGHGTCYPVQGVGLCKCDPGFWLLGTGQCLPVSQASPCQPNPCTEPDKGICTVNSATSAAECSCNPGYDDTGSGCLFQTCPQIAARTAITVYDQTGAGIAEGFDPLQAGDSVKLRIELEVLAGSGEATLELQGQNLLFDLSRLTVDGAKAKGSQKATLTSVPVALTPGLHAVELMGKLESVYYPLSMNARLIGGPGCELPQSRSAARIGSIGQLDPKGFGCIDLDRTRSVQVTHDVVEKNTSAYGQANGTAQDYAPSGSIVSTVTQCVLRLTDRAVFLAGDGRGLLPWAVDNDLIIEIHDHPPAPGDAPLVAVAMGTDSVSSTKGFAMVAGPKPDVPGTHFGIPNGSPFGFSAGHVRLDPWLPKGKSRWLRLVALDQGVVGRLTRLYVVSVPSAASPRRCLSNFQCLGPNGAVQAGCIDGDCTGAACAGGSCASPGQFCVGGFCTSLCNQGGGSCPAGSECKVHGCEPIGAKGMCEASKQDQDCPLGQVCHFGRCEPGCHHPRKQDQSYSQDPSFCQGAKPALCPHCPKPEHGCWNNICAACEIDAHCPAGQWCVNRACTPPG